MAAREHVIDFPVNIGAVLEESARQSNRLLSAATTQDVSWDGSRAYIVGTNTPSFRQQYGDQVVSNDKGVTYFDMHTMGMTVSFRLTREQVEAARENGSLNAILAAKMAENLKGINKAVEYGIIHGYDLATGTKLTAYDHVNGSIAKAVATTGKYVETGTTLNEKLIDGSTLLEDFETTNIFVTPAAFAELYKDKDEKKVIMLDGSLNVVGAPVNKLREVSSLAVVGVQDNTAIIGDFSKIVWGVKALSNGLEEVIAGDPDGLGDLGRRREVAFMFDVAYAWGITHPDAFAVVKKEVVAG